MSLPVRVRWGCVRLPRARRPLELCAGHLLRTAPVFLRPAFTFVPHSYYLYDGYILSSFFDLSALIFQSWVALVFFILICTSNFTALTPKVENFIYYPHLG